MDSLLIAAFLAGFAIGYLAGRPYVRRRYPRLTWSARARMRWARFRI